MYEAEEFRGAGLIAVMIGAVSGAFAVVFIIGLVFLARWLF